MGTWNSSSSYSHKTAHNTQELPELMDRAYGNKFFNLRNYLNNLENQMIKAEGRQLSRVDVFERRYAGKCPDWRNRLN